MIYSSGIPVLLVILYVIYRRRNNRHEEGKFRYRIYKLQRRLQKLASAGYIDVNSQEFNYLDQTLSLAIEKSKYISLFNLLMLEYRHRKFMKDIIFYIKIYSAALRRIESNLYLYEINESRISIFADYIAGRNKITWFLIRRILPAVSNSNRMKKFIRNRIVCSGYLPETSAIRRFLVVASKSIRNISPPVYPDAS